ncbi:tRNA (uridine(34)/cytosine(34)/5-carboxymethylaminomethyluridine(34)-2'-O)-methyltransferase TrmL [Halomonas denitrificans]|uniref:tRNA (uridine(34)/cytosine(34)/5- carboxymethylaminomethyluridine(34)-2'-O)- methyltransferase TrmL n=1 Tax=Halomonas TaxID=2745 RepID=UPI001C94B28A|nr:MULTISPECIES: tRNA (uridine(34)/cytosine(34)/5-carboxymethylaminomethyluridine(34)-2'-O)-methyltransferase TrmL [Halomonas]MEE3214025.1 tRNA (uridine(34)/cytosine(34)/5-carboxymethylaminomethyluridine(34)-2'-O)-methyltransferase TrmL [Pseudomonadota bacterium]MBY5928758.1 tRNA (uridine(34)/cytosine(34)/5-carboxymethylaminomethyluridine(34)-2'-O)-methyltransferase TrmL [Halomonas sp. DP8Y7-3]MBY5983424.1 tRNA (uridine(34)/cytosine(34)/5-carboxymethylaminomethyluridine(34)-2'-O)-methyltransfera
MLDVVLYQPEIPPNTGNLIRLCANTGFRLHLIEPLGFTLDDKRLKRAGLDYHEWARVRVHADWDAFVGEVAPERIFAVSTRGRRGYHEPDYRAGDALVFGPETRGLPQAMLDALPASQRLRIPMLEDSRSLNLSNACAVLVFEAWRQLDFAGALQLDPVAEAPQAVNAGAHGGAQEDA